MIMISFYLKLYLPGIKTVSVYSFGAFTVNPSACQGSTSPFTKTTRVPFKFF